MDKKYTDTVDAFRLNNTLSRDDLEYVLANEDTDNEEYLFQSARSIQQQIFNNQIYLRGLIEFTNYCRNDCYYCGIRCSNAHASRYRLTEAQILSCCDIGERIGFKTFVLQGGEDPYFTDEMICQLVRRIKESHPDCAVTLSIGERSRQSYKSFFDAGADRYLLRHETADADHYSRLHPSSMSLSNRIQCLYDLKEIGFQTGCGIMVGSPYQTIDHLYRDITFMQELKPHMIGIGPFISHSDTPFRDEPDGSVRRTLRLLSILRLLFPKVLLPATTALGTADALGRERGILAGANVLMPNLSPADVREKYLLYDGKICTGEEAAECNMCLRRRVEHIGYSISYSRGDHPDFQK